MSALKPEAEMVSEASRGRYDFDKPENITDLYRQSKYRKPLESGLNGQDSASCRVLSTLRVTRNLNSLIPVNSLKVVK